MKVFNRNSSGIPPRVIKGCQNGDSRAQQEVFQRLYGKMMSVCLRYAKNREEAEDLLQEGFIKVFSKIRYYTGDGSFEGWVRRIIVNTAIDFYRKNKNNQELVNSEVVDMVRSEETENFDDEDLKYGGVKAADVIREIQNLSPAYRAVFNLYVLEGFTHQEIAEQLGISVGTSKSNLAKAKMNLRKLFAKKKVV